MGEETTHASIGLFASVIQCSQFDTKNIVFPEKEKKNSFSEELNEWYHPTEGAIA